MKTKNRFIELSHDLPAKPNYNNVINKWDGREGKGYRAPMRQKGGKGEGGDEETNGQKEELEQGKKYHIDV